MRCYRIAFDLDDVICFRTSEEGGMAKYHSCRPDDAMIDCINRLYDDGHHIIVYTARGMAQFRDQQHIIHGELRELTEHQLNAWGVKFHELVMGKQHYDLLIDDKAASSHNIVTTQDVYDALEEIEWANGDTR